MATSGTDPQVIVQWLQNRSQVWQRFARQLQQQRGRRDQDSREVLNLLGNYRELARDLSLARLYLPNSTLSRYLQGLFLQGHDLLQQQPYKLWQSLVFLFRDEIPQVIRELRLAITISFTIFVTLAIIGYQLVHHYPELASLFASEKMIRMVQSGKLWTDDILNVTPSSVLSLQIMSNNIAVTIFAFVLGAFYGIGTLYILGTNGLMLGAIFAFTEQYGLERRLFEFVIAHGVVELSIIILAAAAGLMLGEALVRPGNRSRSEALRRVSYQSGRLVMLGVPFLIGSGLLEGFVSPNPELSLQLKLSIGLAWGLVLFLVLAGKLRLPRRLAAESLRR